jgi:hypothetical protein
MIRAYCLPFIFCTFISLSGCESNHLLRETKKISHYPSASAIEYFGGRFYVMGDDARYLLVLDSSLQAVDSIRLVPGTGPRLAKAVKHDFESLAIMPAREESVLLGIGSGSLAPWRNQAFLYHIRSGKTDSLRLDSFYATLSQLNIREINIEGACFIPQNLLLVNRGNLGYRKNHLVLTTLSALMARHLNRIQVIPLGGNEDSAVFRGVSGLAYSRRSDWLLLTVSSEETTNALDDGEIGNSYLWIVKNISAKKNFKAINPDEVIDLVSVDPAFRGQKIESVCITKETGDFLHLLLAADNDDGSSTLFRLVVEK